MRLFFLRHGSAQPHAATLSDFDRALTPEGRDELSLVARALRMLDVRPDPILSSPLARARQTAELVAPSLHGSVEVVDELRTGADLKAFASLVQRYSRASSIMFVCHEPDLSEAAAELIGAPGGALTLKKAGLIRLDIDGRFEAGAGRLRWLLSGRQLALLGRIALD